MHTKIMLSPVQEGVFVCLKLGALRVALLVLIEVTGVIRCLDDWHVRSLELLLNKLGPIDGGEPTMVLDVSGAVLEVPVTLGEVGDEQMLDDGLRVPKRI